MTKRPLAKSMLMSGSACAALLAGAALVSHPAQAQGFQGTPTVVQGTVTIDDMTPGTHEITIDGTDAVIDWAPIFDDTTGTHFTFLPAGNTGIFLGTPGAANFAVLNRILPGNLFDPVVFEGLVQAFVQDAAGTRSPGGFVAFYSPTGIIVGPTGRFEVPQLMLTTQDVDLASFDSFANGTGAVQLNGGSGGIDILGGASFVGAPEDSFLIVASPMISMDGDAFYNGSIAYVASESVQLTHSSGLFDIVIGNGPFGGPTIVHTGSSGGPSSTGAGDEHVIYGVTASTAVSGGPVAMLFSGNLGFQPAATAGVVNGDIILSANYNVTGRTVDGDTNRQGANSFFDGRSSTPVIPADILISGLTATSDVLAISTHQAVLDATIASSSFSGNLSLVGREMAAIDAGNGQQVIVGGDLFVSARNFGQNTSIINDENAVGGLALVQANLGALVQVAGQTMVTASAIPGFNSTTSSIGSGIGGQAQILADGGTIALGGAVTVESYARTDQIGPFTASGTMAGGQADFLADNGGLLTAAGALAVDATATTDGPADAFGGFVNIGTGAFGGSVQVGGTVNAAVNAVAGAVTLAAGAGATAQGGSIILSSLGGGDVQFLSTTANSVSLVANADGANVIGGGDGGTGIGGTIAIVVDNASLAVTELLAVVAAGRGGSGANGGLGQAGSLSFDVINGANVLLGGLDSFRASASGGTAATGTGGNAIGGDVGIFVQNSSFNTGQTANFAAFGTAGAGIDGGFGQGGNILVTIDGGSLISSGPAQFLATAQGGAGTLGNGGNATGGTMLVDLIGGTFSSIGASTVLLDAGGTGGQSTGGNGGSGSGGDIALVNQGGTYDSATAAWDIRSFGFGGDALGSGGAGGAGNGGNIDFSTLPGGLTQLQSLLLAATGIGGDSLDLQGGLGQGGQAGLAVAGSGAELIAGGIVSLSADGIGGDVTTGTGTGGAGIGGSATGLVQNIGLLDIGGPFLRFAASAIGGIGATGGSATGGLTGLQIDSATIAIPRLELLADAQAGDGTIGGAATGGIGQATVIGSTADFNGGIDIILSAFGGAGSTGGDATGGTGLFNLASSNATLLGNLTLAADAASGLDTSGGGTAGNAFGGDVAIAIDNSTLTAPTASGILNADAIAGGSTGTGTGGDAFGGTTMITITNGSAVDLGTGFILASQAVSGGTVGGVAGDGFGGLNQFTISGGSDVAIDNLTFATTVTGNNGAAGGNATGGGNLLQVTNSAFDSTSLDILGGVVTRVANATGIGGTAFVLLSDGAQASFGTTQIEALAQALGGNAISTAGTIAVEILGGSTPSNASFGNTEFFNDALGGITNTAGTFNIFTSAGDIEFNSLLVSNRGDTAPAEPSQVFASGGQIRFLSSLRIDSIGPLLLGYSNGGSVIGGTAQGNLTAQFDLNIRGTLTLAGDDASQPSILANSLSASSLDIVVQPLASVFATDVILTSLNTSTLAVIGGTAAGGGYSLLDAEAAQIGAVNLQFSLPALAVSTDLAATIDDLALVGSGAGTLESLRLVLGGPAQIIGQINLDGAGINDRIEINAAQSLQLLLPDGGIAIRDQASALAGNLIITGPNIIMADPALAELILADPTDPAIVTALADDGGASIPDPYIEAASVQIGTTGYFLAQNTGANGIDGGITVNTGQLIIENRNPGSPIRVIAYALGIDPTGSDLTDVSFFNATIGAGTLSGPFTDDATLNDCIINNGARCGLNIGITEVNNSVLVEQTIEPRQVAEEGSLLDDEFGPDFPMLLNAPLISEGELISEPVTSGGDSAVYALTREDEVEGATGPEEGAEKGAEKGEGEQ